MKPIKRCLSAAILLAAATPLTAFAWGRDGHAIVAEIAYDRLSVNARREVRRLLGDQTMVEVSSWPDMIGRDYPETKPWHYVDIPVDGKAEHFDETRDGLKGNNVVDKLKDFEKTLADPTAKKDDRTVALKWVIHLVGDIHQPLHCADRAFGGKPGDRGGNDVGVEFEHSTRPFNLHSAWDSAILDRVVMRDGEDPVDYADEIAKELDDRKNTELQNKEQAWRAIDDPVAWANESHDLAASIVYRNMPTTEPSNPATVPAKRISSTRPTTATTQSYRPAMMPHLIDLTPDYLDHAKPVIVEQLEKAGVRLADVLNGMFP